jgi:Peptidase C13 family
MVSVWAVFKLAVRAAIWRTTPDPPLVGLPTLLGWTIVLAAVRIGLQFAGVAGAPAHFNPYGLNAVAAWLALELAVAALFVRPAARASALSAMFIFSMIADIATALIQIGAPFLLSAAALNEFWSRATVTSAIFAVQILWWLGAMSSVLASLQPESRLRLLARTAALWVALFAAHSIIPDAPVFVPPDFDMRTANWWEYLYAKYGIEREVAQLDQKQTDLLNAEISSLATPHKGTTNIYAVGVAGWADQEVFVKELDGALTSIGTVLPIKDRTLRLINNRQTVSSVPLASPKNLSAAVHAIAGMMDKDEDVLLIFMTSHGDQHGFALQLPANSTELTPQQLAATLDNEGIKNRVVIVSACYSGAFVAPLQNDNTILMTASDEKSTSFGCAPEREWTYFGDALFRQSLLPGTDFQSAFDHARILIQGWELMDRMPPSNPQGSFGPALVTKLAPMFQAGPNDQ